MGVCASVRTPHHIHSCLHSTGQTCARLCVAQNQEKSEQRKSASIVCQSNEESKRSKHPTCSLWSFVRNNGMACIAMCSPHTAHSYGAHFSSQFFCFRVFSCAFYSNRIKRQRQQQHPKTEPFRIIWNGRWMIGSWTSWCVCVYVSVTALACRTRQKGALNAREPMMCVYAIHDFYISRYIAAIERCVYALGCAVCLSACGFFLLLFNIL